MTNTLLSKTRRTKRDVPLLHCGDHLDQPEFHRRYEAYPDPKVRFELIGGVVYMMAPAGFEHGASEFDVCGILSWYAARTPGVVGVSGATVMLGASSEPEPDAALLVRPDYGGQTRLRKVKDKHYVEGPPELVLEVSHSTVGIDLRDKRSDYTQAGVLEYVVVCLEEKVARWFDLAAGEELSLNRQGVIKSVAFPGLWIDTTALLRRDLNQLFAMLEKGLSSAAHQRFVARLESRKLRIAGRKSKATGKSHPNERGN